MGGKKDLSQYARLMHPLPPHPRWTTHLTPLTGGFALLAALAFSALWLTLPNLPLNDLPNHAARAHVMADLLFEGGRRFGALFSLDLDPQPYLLGDLLFAVATEATPTWAPRCLMWLSFVALPAATCVYARALGLSIWARVVAMLLAAFVATDLTTMLGFLQYRLSLPLLLLALAAATGFLRRASLGSWSAFAVCTLAGYFTHLAMPVLLIVTLGGLGSMQLALNARDWRRIVVSHASLALLPLALTAWGILSGPENPAPMLWQSPFTKAATVIGFYSRFPDQPHVGHLLVSMFLLVPLLGCLRGWRSPRSLEVAGMAAALVAGYFLLPSSQGAVFGIDVRAIPLIFLFGGLAALCCIDSQRSNSRRRGAVTAVAVVLTIANFLALWSPLHATDREAARVREVIDALPVGARVLPIPTDGAESRMLHTAEFAVLDRDAYSPYLFSGDQQLPQPYFRYRDRPYAPHEFWVLRNAPVDWQKIQAEWPYLLLVGRSSSRLPVPLPTRTVAANESATLLEIR